jgi:hypothetical protein
MIRFFIACCLLILSQLDISGQIIRGQIIDSKTNKPLEYVSVGIVNTSFGAITDDKGFFSFGYKDQDSSSTVRISMIGYENQTFSIKDLPQNDQVIKLDETYYELDEIIITPSIKRIVGAKGFNKFAGLSGWNVRHIRKGHEIGIKLDLGDNLVKIKSLHVLLHRQAFDTTLYRLHIRRINDTLIKNELLTENIIVSITNESGWAEISLEHYNLIFKGKIGLTLEMLNAIGLNEDRAMKINDRVQKNYILLKNKKKQIGLIKKGPEADWHVIDDNSPSIYLTIME